MKLVTYQRNSATTSDGTAERLGVIVDDRVIDLIESADSFSKSDDPAVQLDKVKVTAAAGLLKPDSRDKLLQLLQNGENGIGSIAPLAAWAAGDEALVASSPKLDEVTLLAPVPRPTSMRDGYAFRQHVEAARRNRGVEMIPEFDLFPVFYFTNHQSVTGPGEVTVMPDHLDRLDFELECAIVIGKVGRNIKASEADEYVAGYTIMNDWSARALQMEEMKMSLGPAKGKDFATSIGPFLATRDELASKRIKGDAGERYDLTMIARVNGTEVSRGNLKDMTWSFAQIIERASYGVTLYPGDVIGSGTVGTGCFLELNGSKVTDNWWLKDGDTVECEVEMLGTLTNTLRLEQPA